MMRRTRAALVCTVLALTLGACSRPANHGKVVILGIDGAEPSAIDLLMSEGKMPNFAKLRQQGAYGRLISSKPLLSPIIWTTIATGKTPDQHKIGHFVAINEKTGEQLPVTSQMRGVKALWDIATQTGHTVDVVGWWATWPAETVNGTIVSDHTCYHFLFDEGQTGAPDTTGLIYPPERLKEIEPFIQRPGDLKPADVKGFVNVTDEEFYKPFSFENELSHFKWALATAHSYTDIGLHLWNTDHPDFLLTYIEGVDSTSHLFGHLFRAKGLAGELAEQQSHYGQTVERMYQYADQIVGRFLDAIDDDTTLVVLSDHGFKLGALHSDPSKTRDMRRVSERYHNIEGILYMYGRGVKAHARIDSPVLVDIMPTVLTLAGISPATDMPGRVLAEALDVKVPERTVASYEDGTRVASGKPTEAPVDPAILAHLRALGYLDTESPTGDRNLAAMHFQAGRYEEAAAAYRKLLEEKPDDGALHASLAGALGAMGDYDGALAELAKAEKLEPLDPETYHNRGVIYERQGKRDAAIAQYRKALRYNPNYEASRTALMRLTGSADPSAPRTDAERLAAAMAQRASEAAQRGDYKTAMSELDQARKIAPDYALVHQYRANVAFLMGDRDTAIAALKRALEIEPDNVLYQRNLEHLERGGTGTATSTAEHEGKSASPSEPQAANGGAPE